MHIIHPLDSSGPAVFTCAQGGCQLCLNALIHRHEGLIHAVIQRQHRGGVAYDDLVQEGRIVLWRAVLSFDCQRGIAFSTYAWKAIERRMWQVVARANRPQGRFVPGNCPNPLQLAEAALIREQVDQALHETLSCLPQRLQLVIRLAYGLEGVPPHTLATIGQQLGVCSERVRQLRNDALVLLRLPIFSARLRDLCDQDSRAAYAQAQALNLAWHRQRRGRKQP
jgi:RNA polymerase sigma factor (sigma-70 family)